MLFSLSFAISSTFCIIGYKHFLCYLIFGSFFPLVPVGHRKYLRMRYTAVTLYVYFW